MKMGKNKLAPKLGVGFVLFVMVMSVFSGAISAADMDIKATDSAIDAGTKNTKNNKLDFFKATTRTKADKGISVLSYWDGVDLRNPTKKVHVALSNYSNLGKFTMGGYYNEQWQTLLYGYPNYGSTSYLTVRVENATAAVNYTTKDYMMDQYVVEHVHGTGDDAVSMKWRLPNDIVIEQNIRLVQDYARIEIDAMNEGSSAKKIGVRYYYDTQVAWSDKAPIYIPGEGVKTTQEEYINPSFTYWKGYDNPTEPTVVSEAKISGADATRPDKLQIGQYGDAQAWENDISPGRTFSDSAVITYWNPTNVAPGQSKQVVTYYGIGAPVARGPFNISEIMVDRVDGSYCPGENVTIKVDVISIGKIHEGSVKIEVLDDGNVLYSSLPKSTGVVPADGATTILFNYSVGVDACNKRLNIKASLHNSSTLSLIDEMTKSAMIIADQSCPECAIKPDLAVNKITWLPDSICDGDLVAVNASIVNIGTDNAADFYLRFEIDAEYIGRKLIPDLPAGSNATIAQSWLARAGSHNVTVYVDECNVIEESDETNNKMTADLPFIPFPDLTVTNISWTPRDIVGGDTVTLTANVKNVGAGSTSSEFYVRFEVDGKSIGHVKLADGLDSGTSTDVTHTWTATWANTINVSVDEDDAVVESDETNNIMSKALPGLPFPDLIVTGLTWEPKENVSAGDPVTFTATIENTGGTFYSTMGSPLKIAFSVNDEEAGCRNIVGGIRAGQPLTTTFTWTAQSGTNPIVCVKVDSTNIIPESDEDNNKLCETVTLAIKSPDLTITQLTFDPTGSIHRGDTVKFTAKVANIGAGDYNGDFGIGFFVGDVYAGATHVANGVPAGENIFSTFNWTASSCSDPVIIAKADFFDTVRESDEDNNEKTEILPASVPYADLEITDITWQPEENIKDRDPVIFNVTVKNRGPGNVITDFNVYFGIDGYFTRTNVISGGLAAGESRTTSFTWKATPGDGHNATAKADPDNVVPESDKTNNEKIQPLPFNVSLVEIFEVRVEPAEITTGIGGQTSCKIKINNYGSASSKFDITVAGLDPSWYILSGSSIYLSAGEEGIIDLAISVPEECEKSGTFTFPVSVTSQETGITKEGSATLIVEPTPVIHDLLPRDRASLGSDDITFSWNTYINATTTIYLKAEDEVEYTSYTGATGQIHTVVASNLARNRNYTYYAESASPCGTFNSTVRAFYIGNGISFTRDVYEFTVARDYNQRVTIRVQNTDNEYHELLVEVPITYDDLVLGFVGDGSQDNIIPLNPGESKDVTLAIQCADAQKEDYELIATLTSTKGDAILTDTTRIKLHVHVPRIDYDLDEISVDPITLTKTFKLRNKGDPITDLTISPADNLKGNAHIEPTIEHFRLEEGASIEFDVVPILSSPDFQASSEAVYALSGVEAASSAPGASGDMVITAGEFSVAKPLNFAIPVGKNVHRIEVPNVIWEKHINTWFCNNRPNIEVWWEMVSGIQKDKVILDPLIIKFSQQGWDVKPHDVYISVNGHEVGSLINTVPEGYYKFDVDPSFLIYSERGVSSNCIEIHTVHQNGGHYVVGSDIQVHLDLKGYTTHLVASSEEEANQIALANLPPGFYKVPDSINIRDGDVVSLTKGYTVLASSTAEVLLGAPTTLQATTSPNLMVWAEFDNGDAPVYLAEEPSGSGAYRGEWTPQNYPVHTNGLCVITIKAKGPGPGNNSLLQGQIQRTVKIINPTKLKVVIIAPKEGFEVSTGDAVVVSARVTRTDDQGRDYGSPDSSQTGVTAYFLNGDGYISLIPSVANDGVYTGIWVPENEGSCTIEVDAADTTGKLKPGSASVSGNVADFALWGDDLWMSVGTEGESIITIESKKGFNRAIYLEIANLYELPIALPNQGFFFDPNPVIPQPDDCEVFSTLTVIVPLTAKRGTYEVIIIGGFFGTRLTRTTTITLTIVPGISGDVLEVGLFDPIPGAVVRAEGIEGTPGLFFTNAPNSGINPDDGTYWLMVPPGVYTVWATAPGYIPSKGYFGDRVVVEAGKETEGINFRLAPIFTKICGNVTDINTGLPISDASIDVIGPPYPYEPYKNVTLKTRTDVDGNYSIILEYSVHPDGNYNVTASKEGYLSQSTNVYVNWNTIISSITNGTYTWIHVNFLLVPIPGVTCSNPAVIIDNAQTAVTDDPVSEGYDVSNAPANVDLTTAKGFTITARGPDGAYLFDITFPTPVTTGFVLYKLPAWTEIPYNLTGAYRVQVRLAINEGVLDPAFILASLTGAAAVCGDVTGDNKVTMGDARRIEMWLSYPEDYPIHNLWAADVTGDGEVTGDDARRIIMWLSDPEQYPLACRTP